MNAPLHRARLERRYRILLRAYPADYRRERADEIVGTLMSTADDHRRWPSLGDAVDLGSNGLRTRIRLSRRGMRQPMAADAARHAGLVTLAVAAAAVVAVVLGVSVFGHTAFGRAVHKPRSYGWPSRLALGLVLMTLPAALAAYACGLDRWGRRLAIAGSVGALGSGVVIAQHGLRTGTEQVNGSFLFGIVALCWLPGLLLWKGRGSVDDDRGRLAGRCLVLGVALSVVFGLWIALPELYEVAFGPYPYPAGTVLPVSPPNLGDSGLNLFAGLVLLAVAAWNAALGWRRPDDVRPPVVAWAMSVPWLASALGTALTPVLFRPGYHGAGIDRWQNLSTDLVQVGYTTVVVVALTLVAVSALGRSDRSPSTP
jgi:hypothetical protein